MSLDDLYREVILDHYRNPRNKRALDGAEIDLAHNNPLCGDEISVRVKVGDGMVADAAFEGQGCSISQASASMLTDRIKGMKLGDVDDLILKFRGMMAGKETPDDEALGDLVALKGVVKYPVRIKCAVLAWDTLQEGVETFRKGGSGT
jgi:nitrogen fixation NifU-like protein